MTKQGAKAHVRDGLREGKKSAVAESAAAYGLQVAACPSGGWAVIPGDMREQARLVKAGVPSRAFEELAGALDSSRERLATLANIAPRTLVRRLKDGVLAQDEGERVLRIARVFEAACRLFSGDVAAARHWLNTAGPAFEDRSPLEYSDTEPGALFVLDMIGRIEHGVFS